jgi:hypothetical protein
MLYYNLNHTPKPQLAESPKFLSFFMVRYIIFVSFSYNTNQKYTDIDTCKIVFSKEAPMQLSDKFHNIHWKNLITAVAIPLAVGGLSAWITKDGMKAFETVNQPPLTPPMWLFPVVWSILFVLMGIASYLVVMQKGEDTKALTLYAVQLIFNFFWSIWFFNLGWYLFAFLWLVALWILILATTVAFYRISKPAAWLMLPYLVWVAFAGYLNLGVWWLNR